MSTISQSVGTQQIPLSLIHFYFSFPSGFQNEIQQKWHILTRESWTLVCSLLICPNNCLPLPVLAYLLEGTFGFFWGTHPDIFRNCLLTAVVMTVFTLVLIRRNKAYDFHRNLYLSTAKQLKSNVLFLGMGILDWKKLSKDLMVTLRDWG